MVCRHCNTRLTKVLVLGGKEYCPNCKSDKIFEDFPTPEEQKKKWNLIIRRIKDGYY